MKTMLKKPYMQNAFTVKHMIPAVLLVTSGLFSSAMAQATPPAVEAESEYEVIIYDAETVAALNNKAAAPSMEAPRITTEPIMTTRPVTPAPSIPVQPAKPTTIDISSQFTDIIEGVPIIEDPTSCGANALEIGIVVENVAKTKGVIVADLHDDIKENFLVWDKVVLRVRQTAQEGETKFCMPLTKPGDYAIGIYHDKDNDRKFDKGFLGIPKEHFGMSQNPKFGLSKPKYEDAVFTVPASGTNIRIILRKASDFL